MQIWFQQFWEMLKNETVIKSLYNNNFKYIFIKKFTLYIQ